MKYLKNYFLMIGATGLTVLLYWGMVELVRYNETAGVIAYALLFLGVLTVLLTRIGVLK